MKIFYISASNLVSCVITSRETAFTYPDRKDYNFFLEIRDDDKHDSHS